MKTLFSNTTSTITGAAIILGAASFVSRFVGIVRDRILAHNFGAGDVLDAYFAAFKIPDMLYLLLISGALSVGLIPVLAKVYKHEDKNPAWRLVNNIVNISGVILFFSIVILIAVTPYLMPAIAPGFTGEKTRLTVTLTRIMFLSPLFLSFSAIVGGVLQTLKQFFVYSLSPIFYNLGIIIGATVFVPMMGNIGLAWGVVLGAVLHLAVQLPSFFKTGFRYRARLNLKDKNLRQIGRLMIPRVLALSALHINLVVITAIASTLTVGSVAIFNYANNLQSFPQGIIGISFAVAAFPALSFLIAQNRRVDFIKNFSSTTRQILFFIIPLSIIFLLLRAQIVRVVLGTGAFDWAATVNTADALAFFSLGLFAQALLPLLIRAYYALEDTKTPFFISLIAVAINIILSLWLTKWRYQMGAPGMALAFTISGILNFALLWVFLRFKIHDLDEGRIIRAVFKFTVAGIFMGIIIQLSKNFIAPFVDMQTFWGIFIQGVVAGLLGCFTYIIIGLILKCHEMKIFVETIKKKLVRIKNLPKDISEIGEV